MKRLIIIFLVLSSLASKAQIAPGLHTVINKPILISTTQGAAFDALSQLFDGTNLLYRDYQSLTEARTYLAATKWRVGKHLIFIHDGGTLNSNGTYTGGITKIYVWGNGTTDNALVPYLDFLTNGNLTVDADGLVHAPVGIESSDIQADNFRAVNTAYIPLYTGSFPAGDSTPAVNFAALYRALKNQSAPGSNSQVVFNDGGKLGASSYLLVDKNNGNVYMNNTLFTGAVRTASPVGSVGAATYKWGGVELDNTVKIDINGTVHRIPLTTYNGFSGAAQTLQNVTAAGNVTNLSIELSNAANGLIIKSPDGSRWMLTIDNDGVFTTTKL